jgi:hypothetical protein
MCNMIGRGNRSTVKRICQNRRAFKELTVGVPLKELTDQERERETLFCLSVRLPFGVFIRHVISQNFCLNNVACCFVLV